VQVVEQTVQLGTTLAGNVCTFRVWAPSRRSLTLRLNGADHEMRRDDEYFVAQLPARPGDRYLYVVDDLAVPDPVSRHLPEGVHGPTEILDPDAFAWTDSAWKGFPLRDYIVYELHVGTFTPEGTFDAAIAKLPYLKGLGISVIEVMPVSAFPGGRNWGYDGVSPYAVQTTYSGPEAFKRFIDAAHAHGLAVMIDVVYNHLGNEGNYLRLFGPYFTARHTTPWGEAIDYSQRGVREYVVQHALFWIREYHLDGLRLDAVQTIYDDSPRHILAEVAENAHALGRELGREVVVIAETDENDSKLIREYGLDAFWSDDLHHAIHAFLTGERNGYYQDFGAIEPIVRALNEGYVFQGEHFNFWDGPRGTPARDVPLPANVICVQNHDQVGNRARGERLTTLVPSAAARQAAAALFLLAPHTPLLFMGQEYDETHPFQFFTSYGDPQLREAVRKGRRQEFKDFDFRDVPDPEDEQTFLRSKLDWSKVTDDNAMLNWYQELIDLRKRYVTVAERRCRAELSEGMITMQVPANHPKVLLQVNFSSPTLGEIESAWKRVMYAADESAAVAIYIHGGLATGY
jgi:maltooligosyltrehalose trehalohydrolase